MKQKTELTDAELNRQDFLVNKIHELIFEVNPDPNRKKYHKWDIEIIGEVADVIESYFVRNKICTAQEFNPYIEAK